MLDVHAPHEAMHGWRDFLLHLVTITIGLLIALSLEGCVEWQHHRHLVHQAEASLHVEIRANAEGLKGAADDIRKQREALKHDVVILNYILKNGKAPDKESMEIDFHIRGFKDVSWKTAQSTGALSYMPYDLAQQYSSIYGTQDQLLAAEQVAARDAILSLGPFVNAGQNDPDPTDGQAAGIRDHIQALQGQLVLVDAIVTGLNGEYQKFLAAHPE